MSRRGRCMQPRGLVVSCRSSFALPPPSCVPRGPPTHPHPRHHPTAQGGNDYEIYESELTIGHTVTSPEDTRKQCTELFMS